MKMLTLPDGRRLAYREAGHGPNLVLLHGWSLNSAVFSELTALLSQDFRTFAIDLTGHGFSDPDKGCDLACFAADVSVALDHLSPQPAAILGWSLGGQVALRLVCDNPQRCRRLVLMATTPRFVSGPDWDGGLPEIQVRGMARKLSRSYDKTLDDFFADQFTAGELSDRRLDEIVEFAVRASRRPQPETALAALETLRREDLRSIVPDISCPALVIHGREDRVTPVNAGRFLAEHLPQGYLWEMENTGHAPFLSHPQSVAATVQQFLQ